MNQLARPSGSSASPGADSLSGGALSACLPLENFPVSEVVQRIAPQPINPTKARLSAAPSSKTIFRFKAINDTSDFFMIFFYLPLNSTGLKATNLIKSSVNLPEPRRKSPQASSRQM